MLDGWKAASCNGLLRACALLAVSIACASASPIARPATPHVRVMTWNISANSVFADGKRHEAFARIMRALRPDVVCLQEIFPPRTPEDLGPLLDSVAPLVFGARWQSYGIRDVAIVTPHPISMRAARQDEWGGGVPRSHAMALVTLPSTLGVSSLYVICTHMQSRGEAKDIAARQRQAQAIVQWLREVRAPEAVGGLEKGTAIAILGDFNAYRTDPGMHMNTLLAGPDWDGAALLDSGARHNGIGPAFHTWGPGPFPPAALDRILYTGSRLAIVASFVLNTTTLDEATLARLNLKATDVLLNATAGTFDHLPVVADFISR